MVDRRYRDNAWGTVPNASPPAARTPVELQQAPAATPVASSPSTASSEPHAADLGPSVPATSPGDGWGRPLAPVGTSQAPAGRNARGQFVSGSNGGPGRKKGSRNRLTSAVLSAFATDFEEHGAETLAKLRDKDPAAYLQMAINLIPRQLITQHETLPDFESWEEVNEFLEQAKRKRMIEIALEELNKDHPTLTKD